MELLRVDHENDEPGFYWKISREQSGIGYSTEGKYFDDEPDKWKKWNWKDNVGSADEWYLEAHLCAQCIKEYEDYIRNYKAREVDLSDLSTQDFLKGKAKMKIEELKEALRKDKEQYKRDFLNQV
jgi:hypothetical protein